MTGAALIPVQATKAVNGTDHSQAFSQRMRRQRALDKQCRNAGFAGRKTSASDESRGVLCSAENRFVALLPRYLSLSEIKPLNVPFVTGSRANNQIDIICEELIRLAVSAMGISTTSASRPQLMTLEAVIVGLDPDARAAIVEHLDAPGRFERINEWAQLVRGAPSTARRPSGKFSRAMTRVLAIEIIWRLAANRELPSFLA